MLNKAVALKGLTLSLLDFAFAFCSICISISISILHFALHSRQKFGIFPIQIFETCLHFAFAFCILHFEFKFPAKNSEFFRFKYLNFPPKILDSIAAAGAHGDNSGTSSIGISALNQFPI